MTIKQPKVDAHGNKLIDDNDLDDYEPYYRIKSLLEGDTLKPFSEIHNSTLHAYLQYYSAAYLNSQAYNTIEH